MNPEFFRQLYQYVKDRLDVENPKRIFSVDPMQDTGKIYFALEKELEMAMQMFFAMAIPPTRCSLGSRPDMKSIFERYDPFLQVASKVYNTTWFVPQDFCSKDDLERSSCDVITREYLDTVLIKFTPLVTLIGEIRKPKF